jgi:hypothetical protein
MPVDLSGEITAIATAVLAVFAIVTGIYAVRAFRKQSKEVSDQAEMLRVQSEQLEEQRKINAEQTRVLALQAEELRESLGERKREADQRRRAQAAQVFISEEHAPGSSVKGVTDSDRFGAIAFAGVDCIVAIVTVVNGSNQPIYDAELRWYHGSADHGDPNPEPLGTIMPGKKTDTSHDFPLDTNMAVSGAILTFRDAAGVNWIRTADGSLMSADSDEVPVLAKALYGTAENGEPHPYIGPDVG